MTTTVRYLSASDVRAAMPPVAERIALAERTMVALVADAELPPKIAVHPRPEGSFAHAMPAALRPHASSDASADLLGLKWVAGFPANRERGLPAIHAVVLLTDASTGTTRAILDGGPITAERTAAVSGVAISRFAREADRNGVRVAIIGAGVQGHSHVAMLGHVLPGAIVSVADRHLERAEALADLAAHTPGIGAASAVGDAKRAARDADVVISAAAFTEPARRQVMTDDWLRPDALVVAVDYATMCAASVAREAALFVVDERGQFLANRDAGQFDDYPDPDATLGETILADTTPPPSGRIVVTHLGVGLADVVFADAIVRRAEADDVGTLLTG